MNQELKVLRDWLRLYGGQGIYAEACTWPAPHVDHAGFSVTRETVRALVGLLDRLEQQSERVDGYARDV